MNESVYKVKTGTFEGPMELLLSLIEDRKLFINEISLANVTDDYLSYIKNLGEISLARIANFIIVASTLILIKSRSLLPEMTLSDEEKGNIFDLETRLNIYRIIKEAGINLKEALFKQIIWERPAGRIEKAVFLPDKSFTTENVAETMSLIVSRLPKKEILPKVVVKKVVSLEEMIGRITDRIQNELSVSFSRFSGHTGEESSKEKRVTIIVGFLALLELVKQGLVQTEQKMHFDDITISSTPQ